MTIFSDPLHQESAVPVGERFLVLEGKLSALLVETRIHQRMSDTLIKYRDRLTPEWRQAINTYQQLCVPPTSIYFAVSFAYATLPIGKTFDVLFPARRPDAAGHAPSVLLAVIGEWNPLPRPSTSAGHRSICLIDFPDGVPSLIQNLAEVEQFMQHPVEQQVWLASTETWQYVADTR